MNPGLVWLLRRAPLTLLRNLRRRARGVKGVLMSIVIVIFVLLMLVPAVIEGVVGERDTAELAARAREFGPVMLLGMTGISLLTPAHRRGGLYFRPAEIGVLFPAPITRRELLAYHVISRGMIQALSAAWVSLFVFRYAPTLLGCVLGVLGALLFLQLTSQVLAIATATAGKRFAWPVRLAVLVLVVGAFVFAAARSLAGLDIPRGEEMAVARTLLTHPAVQIVTAPFAPFANTFAAESFGAVLLWGGVSFLLVALVTLLLSRLDVAYEEAALDVSRNVGKKLERMRSGGGAMAAIGPGKARFSVPALPSLRGAGPVAWRQIVEISRNVKAIALSFALLLIWPLVVGGAVLFTNSEGDTPVETFAVTTLSMLVMISIVSTQNIGFDFRRDLDRIAFLRSLPVSSPAVAAGQIAPTSALLGVVQWASVLAVIAFTGVAPVWWIVVSLPLFLVFSWAVIAIDNVLFLLLPHRIDPQDAGFMGKLMLVMFLKFAVLGGIGLAAAGIGVGAGFIAGRSVVVGALAGTLVVLLADVGLTFATAGAFARFDPGRDTPA